MANDFEPLSVKKKKKKKVVNCVSGVYRFKSRSSGRIKTYMNSEILCEDCGRSQAAKYRSAAQLLFIHDNGLLLLFCGLTDLVAVNNNIRV